MIGVPFVLEMEIIFLFEENLMSSIESIPSNKLNFLLSLLLIISDSLFIGGVPVPAPTELIPVVIFTLPY